MKFAWTEKDKERFFKRAERQLKAAGIDFVQVDRSQIGVKEWDAEKQTAGTVYVWLTSYPYNHFSTRKRGLLKKVGKLGMYRPFQERRKQANTYALTPYLHLIQRGKETMKKESPYGTGIP